MNKHFVGIVIGVSLIAASKAVHVPAMAADSNGDFYAVGFPFCDDFLKQSRKERVAKALANDHKDGHMYDRLYDRNYHFILGMVAGFNAGQANVYNALPDNDGDAIVELVIIECARNPRRNIANVVIELIDNNKNKWQIIKNAPRMPALQTSPAR